MNDLNNVNDDYKSLHKINWFEESQLRICLWCKYAGLFFNTEDKLESVVCLKYDNMIKKKKDRPPNNEYRYYLKVMESFESCDEFAPTNEKDERLIMLEWLGIIKL